VVHALLVQLFHACGNLKKQELNVQAVRQWLMPEAVFFKFMIVFYVLGERDRGGNEDRRGLLPE
jgi:hypothetical protein